MSNLNFVQATLGLPVTNTGNVITLNPAVAPYQLPPTDGGILVLTDSMGLPTVFEIVSYSARSGNNLTGVVRGLEGTTARAWPANSYSFQALTAGGLTTLQALKQDFITAGTAAQYYRGDKTMATLNKAAVGLANVDNTADTAKPVSIAQQAALDAKATPASVLAQLLSFGIGSGLAPTCTDLNALRGTNFFGHSHTATGAPISGSGSAYDAVGFQIEAAGQRTQFSVLAEADIRTRTDDGSGTFGDWGILPTLSSITSLLAGKVDLAGGLGARMTGELQSTSANYHRAIQGNYGTIWRNDGASLYLMVTASGDQYGQWTSQRPLIMDLASGILSINGNARTAELLKTARKIGGTLFDGSADIGIDAQWKGDTAETMPTGATAYSGTDQGLYVDGIYGGTSKGYPINYGNRIQIRGHALAVNEVFFEWTNGAGSRVFVRSRADVNTHQWSSPREVAFVDGNIATASKLATGRNIALSGDASGSITFDGSGNVVIPVVVADDSHNHIISNVDGLQAALDAKQASLGFTPVQMGTGTGQTANVVKIGWTSAAQLALQIDATNFGSAWPISATLGATKLTTARTINGVAFDGTGNITVADSTKAAKGDNDDIITIRAQRYVDKLVTNTAATGTVTLNCLLASVFELTLTGNTTLAFSNLPPMSGETYSVLVTVKQGATARILTMPASTTYITSGNAAIPTPAANKQQDYIFTTKNAGSSWEVRAGAAT